MISRRSFLTGVAATVAVGSLAACGKKNNGTGGGKTVTLGFSQVGSESGWRSANTTSIKDAAGAAGINLKFSDAQQKQENQIQAIRDYITQKVDVISFSPVVSSGWDTVLKEAKAAKIPVILTDRQVDADASLWVSLVGSDFEAEGERAAHLLEKVLGQSSGPVNIAVLEGTTGSAPATQRAAGFKKVMDASHPEWKIVASQTGNFTRDGGKQVMAAFLQSHPEANVLFAHNDDMALGAIQSIQAAGRKPGTDIKIVSIDGVHDGFVAMTQGQINAIAECNPLLGPQLMDTVKKVLAKQSVEKWIKTQESDFLAADAASALPNRKY
ncbi:ABC transporter substrate-binding protein [Planosporangium mesophilum]|uniref:LacI family transcriptional regulator n=1 Tax=Planosporangium mesophilum TaxID=689768 RepID=A0A8J3TGS7_9ACTN|nr:ABC transporter substrate-binding protein [Planosporangium mesophilum]NJC86374.1 ABC transporter substrate-binding protein [Planosporangium mesophilum]GII25989.1 LacI family transcriptional regulator [Planosporangium mesophilum]